MQGKNKLKIGDLLIKEGLLSEAQLTHALKIQKSQKIYKPLGEICVDLQFISRNQLQQVLSRHQKRILIGDLLVNLGLITDAQLHEALARQKQTGTKLGETLIELGSISEESLINTLTLQLGVAKIVPDAQLIDRNLMRGLSEEFLKKNIVLPAFKENDILTVIMGDPLDEGTIRTLGQILRCQIDPAIAPRSDILKAIHEFFHAGEAGVSNVFREKEKDLVIGDTKLAAGSGDNIVSILDYVITQAILEGASDIHIEPREKNVRVRYRIDGILRHKTDLPATLALKLSSRIKAICGLDIAEKRKHQDGRIEARVKDREVDLRISTFASVYGENIVIRVLHRQSDLIELDSLGLSPVNRANLQRLMDQPAGIILVTGPTGSGKTTTLYASLNYLNDGQRAIITVEDPVEYIIEGVVQGQLNPQLGHTYVDFLKSMMRQDPDVIMVGEIRDSTAAHAVIQAALTGHKVLSTFHTDDTTGALLRLMDMGIDTFLISSTVVSVVAQRLVRLLCKHCRKPHEPEAALLSAFHISPAAARQYTFYQPVGCPRCGNSGFKGRTAIHELLRVNDAIRDAILVRKTSTQIRMIARDKARLISMREDGFYKATMGLTSLEEVLRVVFYNESDELNPRSGELIRDLCENTAEASSAPALPSRNSSAESNVIVLEGFGGASAYVGEIFRMCFDTAAVAAETEKIADFFAQYRDVCANAGRHCPEELLEEFIRFIIYSVQRVETLFSADSVELSIRVEDGRPRIVLEALVPEGRPSLPKTASREKNLRQVNSLFSDSGMVAAVAAESGLMERGLLPADRPRLLDFLSSPTDDVVSPASRDFANQGPRLYKKHSEELAWRYSASL